MSQNTPDSPERSIAIVGASADRSKFGNKSVRAYKKKGYDVWPVNPKGGGMEGLYVYRDLDSLPGLPHQVSIYLREEAALEALETIARLEREADGKISAVFLNPGADTHAVVRRAEQLDLRYHTACSILSTGHSPSEFGDE